MKKLLIYLVMALLLITACRQESNYSSGYVIAYGDSLYYQSFGTGDPILVIHGGPVLDQSYLLPGMEKLAEGHRVIFYDQLLCGKSSWQVDSSEISLERFMQDLDSVRIKLHLGKVHLLGHSWGGWLAMQYAIRYPDNLKSLILVSSMPGDAKLRNREDSLLQLRFTPRDREDMQKLFASKSFQQGQPRSLARYFKIAFKREMYDTTLIDSLVLELPSHYLERSNKFYALGPALANYNLYPELEKLTIPSLIIYGSYDPLAQLAGPELHKHLPGSHLEILEKCGHFPYLESPRFFGEIDRFLGQLPPKLQGKMIN